VRLKRGQGEWFLNLINRATPVHQPGGHRYPVFKEVRAGFLFGGPKGFAMADRSLPAFPDSQGTSGETQLSRINQRPEGQNLWPECRQIVQSGCGGETEGLTEGLSEPNQNGLSGRRPHPQPPCLRLDFYIIHSFV